MTGHDLKAKCEVANALCRQHTLFRMLGCRTRCITKTIRDITVVGRQVQVIVSPNMSTPAWAKLCSELKYRKQANLFIVYIKTKGLADINDEASVDEIQKKLMKPVVVSFLQNENDMFCGSKEETITFHNEMSLEDKRMAAERILQEVKMKLPQIEPATGDMSVQGRGKVSQKKLPNPESLEPIVPLSFSKEEQGKINGKCVSLRNSLACEHANLS